MLLSEKVRIEVFIPDLPDPAYVKLPTQLQTEVSYAFGGCTVVSASGTFLSASGIILPDKISILFTDIPLNLKKDRLLIGQYTERIRSVAREALQGEETILVSAYTVFHDE
ncbi:MAG: hypothetical protein DMF72_16325 [Acidobacteria bacterium]|nr:MAG: hypothetical protein DMF72_16325 [Acidobacteriota bacterium]